MAGATKIIECNYKKQIITIFDNFHDIIMLSFPQTNVHKLHGMKKKKNYLIWREKNDFFTALNIKGTLCTWSLATGDRLYKRYA